MKTIITVILLCVGMIVTGQEYTPQIVHEFPNVKTRGNLYYETPYGSDSDSGNSFVFDENGDMYVLQYDQSLLYRINGKTYEVEEIRDSVYYYYHRITKADENGIEMIDGSTAFISMDHNGNLKINVQINRLIKEFRGSQLSFYYYPEAEILLFVDDKYSLYSIIRPGTDDEENRRNYRNSEQTEALFREDSDYDMKGLTRDEKGKIYKDGVYIGPKFMPVVGKYRYSFTNSFTNTNVLISDGTNRLLPEAIRFPLKKNEVQRSITNWQRGKYSDDDLDFPVPAEVNESTAIHPSGDIYFLRLDWEKNKHILYRIENTWDVETKVKWEQEIG